VVTNSSPPSFFTTPGNINLFHHFHPANFQPPVLTGRNFILDGRCNGVLAVLFESTVNKSSWCRAAISTIRFERDTEEGEPSVVEENE
jgi:hypothetical protein